MWLLVYGTPSGGDLQILDDPIQGEIAYMYKDFLSDLGLMWDTFWDFLNYDLVLFHEFHFTIWNIIMMCFYIGAFRFIARKVIFVDWDSDFNLFD